MGPVLPGPRLDTERLILRPPLPADFEPWAGLLADEEAARHIGGVRERAEAWRALLTMAGSWSIQGFGMFSVVERASGDWIGRVGPWRPLGWPGPEVGWALVPSRWGRGLAREAATAAIDWAFDALGWDEVVHVIAPGNAASRRLAGRLGSSNRGPARLPAPHAGERADLWGQTRAEWAARRRSGIPASDDGR